MIDSRILQEIDEKMINNQLRLKTFIYYILIIIDDNHLIAFDCLQEFRYKFLYEFGLLDYF